MMELLDFAKHPHGPPPIDRISELLRLGGVKESGLLEWITVVNGTKEEYVGNTEVRNFGTVLVRDIFGLNSGHESVQMDHVNHRDWNPVGDDTLIFANDFFGNYFFVFRRNPEKGLYFWDHETADVQFVAKDFRKFLSKIQKIEVDLSDPEECLKMLLRKDSVPELRSFIETQGIAWRNNRARNLMEDAAVHGACQCIRFLYEMGIPVGKSLEIARKNAQFFPEHLPIVKWLEGLSNPQP